MDRTWQGGRDYISVPIRAAYTCRFREFPVFWDCWRDFPIMTGAVPESEWRERLWMLRACVYQ